MATRLHFHCTFEFILCADVAGHFPALIVATVGSIKEALVHKYSLQENPLPEGG